MSYGRRYYGEDDDVREKTVPRLHIMGHALAPPRTDPALLASLQAAIEPIDEPMCCVCQMPMRDEKPCHWIGDEPMHKDCVGPSIVGVRKG